MTNWINYSEKYGRTSGYTSFTNIHVKEEQSIRIPKGTKIRVPAYLGQTSIQIASEDSVVTVCRTLPGIKDNPKISGRKNYNRRNPEVVWAGDGGYWFMADINDIEVIDKR